jgi:excisionase family DNA binding protein
MFSGSRTVVSSKLPAPNLDCENDLSARETASELHLLAYRIPDVCKLTGLGRTTIYAAIKAGALIARRYGRCTIVLAEDLAAFLRNLPTSR